jgi:hypothetical protein
MGQRLGNLSAGQTVVEPPAQIEPELVVFTRRGERDDGDQAPISSLAGGAAKGMPLKATPSATTPCSSPLSTRTCGGVKTYKIAELALRVYPHGVPSTRDSRGLFVGQATTATLTPRRASSR